MKGKLKILKINYEKEKRKEEKIEIEKEKDRNFFYFQNIQNEVRNLSFFLKIFLNLFFQSLHEILFLNSSNLTMKLTKKRKGETKNIQVLYFVIFLSCFNLFSIFLSLFFFLSPTITTQQSQGH